ncbi:NADH:flavin oxidoreductase [Psychroserpens burtonensis]|uniref:NADH:flavin oxidoreductase n=1 Tax=Psychroserpens burtonensis TaxID=49278 RepID=A0A5C7BBQ7_9FLAO|nr:NADH:flavin oxidoreductase [Psychroserpens burtonensis]TXE16183.1 NADH:flavin oxidoreductase [Psychroserpens burtonensis]
MHNSPNTPLTFKCGVTMSNRFMLAPMTNSQSRDDGTLSNDEFNWLTMRAKEGFGLTMTCASHVQAIGKGFPGQLGFFSDHQIDGHKRLAAGIHKEGCIAVIQLHHAGMRSPENVIGEQPVCPSVIQKHNARALTLEEVYNLRNDFIDAAIRAQKSGYDGVEVHGAHGYILTQFLSTDINKRKDIYGGNLKNRARLLFEIVDGIRKACGAQFLLGVRLSPERFGMQLHEVKIVSQQLIDTNQIDFLDISLWDVFKTPENEAYRNKSLLAHFEELDYKNVKWTVAGKISSGEDVQKVLNTRVDFVSIGKSGILHHDFPKQVIKNPNFEPIQTPVSEVYLEQEGLGNAFVTYMKRWDGFVRD